MIVAIGKRVTVSDVETSTEQNFHIVAPGQSNPSEGKLSSDSPIGRALSGHGSGDTVIVNLPRGQRQLTILTVV